MSRFIAVDPGLHSAGWAVFDRLTLPSRPGPLAAGLVRASSKLSGADLLTRAVNVGFALADVATDYLCSKAFIEFPVFYPGADARGNAIFKLCACAGAIAGCLSSRNVAPKEVFVPDWKGQLPKDIVNQRIAQILGDHTCLALGLRADTWDAVGIGLYIKGRL